MRRIVIAAIMVLMASLILPGSALAWEQFPCDSGELRASDAWIGVGTEELPSNVHIPGAVTCGVLQPGAEFVVAVFEFGKDRGYYHSELMVKYASPMGPTNFTVVGELEWPLRAVDTGLCIMPDKNTRLSCVQVSTDLKVKELSASDPEVMRDIVFLPDVGPSPGCATCFRV